jgi:predicted lipid-binding transport protein (Tim44 family)
MKHLGETMKRAPLLFAGLAALSLVLAPAAADARAGGGSSSGSRGGRTYTAPPSTNTAPSAAQPMQRSMTPNQPTAAAPAAGAMPGAAAQPSRWGGSFAAGLMGGIIGAGIGGMLFGHGFTGGLGSAAGFIGFLLQIALFAGIAFLIMRLIRGRRPAMVAQGAGGPAMFEAPQGAAPGGPAAGMMGGSAAPAQAPVQLGQADFGAFEQTLKDVQAAWSGRDLQAMQNVATMEMVSYFADDMADQQSRGVQNTVSDVRLVKGDLAEAWREGNREYATVAMRFSMVDVTRNAAGHVVDGNPNQPVEVTELWTFVRSSGGRWMLSAIQQTR